MGAHRETAAPGLSHPPLRLGQPAPDKCHAAPGAAADAAISILPGPGGEQYRGLPCADPVPVLVKAEFAGLAFPACCGESG